MEVIHPHEENKKIVAGVMALILGCFGVHKFVLGYTNEGIIMLILGLVSLGSISSIIGLIEGIIYLTKSDSDFYHTYQLGRRPWF